GQQPGVWQPAGSLERGEWRSAAGLARALRVKQALVIKQAMAKAVGLAGGVNGGLHRSQAALPSLLVDLLDGRDMMGGMIADEEERVPQPWMTATGDAAATAIIATLLQDGVKAGKSPHLLRPVKAAVVLQVAQVASGQQRTDTGDRGQDGGRGVGHQLLHLLGQGRQLLGQRLIGLSLLLELGCQQRCYLWRRQDGGGDNA